MFKYCFLLILLIAYIYDATRYFPDAFVGDWAIVLPIRFAPCPPAAFKTSSPDKLVAPPLPFTYAKRIGNTISRFKRRSTKDKKQYWLFSKSVTALAGSRYVYALRR